MSPSAARPVTIEVDDTHRVSGLLLMPPRACPCFVLAHGAGAGMTHPFMEAVAAELGMRSVPPFVISFPTWSEALSGRTRPASPMPLSAAPWPQPPGSPLG